MRLAVLICAIVLASCRTAADDYAEAMADHATCESYGLELATPEYANCRLSLQQMRAERTAQRRAAISNALIRAGQGTQVPMYHVPPPALPNPAPGFRTTNCQRFGTLVSCQTY